MAQDIRELFKKDQENAAKATMPNGHQERFLNKLEDSFSEKKPTNQGWSWMQIAASVVLLIGLSFGAYKFLNPSGTIVPNEVVTNETKKSTKSLGDISPDLKKVEDYYLANINLELSKVKLTPQNKELFDGYIVRLDELNKEYSNLSNELTENGPSEYTVNALINNLKLRLNLLYRLKEKLKDLNTNDMQAELG